MLTVAEEVWASARMSRLFLVRHGQASFLTEDYDRLSDLGEKQSHLLGEWFAKHNISFDHAFTGPRKRQRDTGAIARKALLAAGLDHPECEEIDDLDECHTDMHFDRFLPELKEQFPHLVALEEAFVNAEDHSRKRKTFQHLFDGIMRLYIHEKFTIDGLETWSDFMNRVARAMHYMTADKPNGVNVIAYTSGGTIAAANHHVIKTAPDPTLEFMWQGRNAGVTEYMFSGTRMSLVAFNGIPHLDDASLWTHR